MMTKSEHFYAKILLFGEYGVILGSQALSIPYTHFAGELSFITDDKYTDYNAALNSNENLKGFAAYLRNKRDLMSLTKTDIIRMEKELADGLYFESSIPQGYGVGSSGALVAAFYARYAGARVKASASISQKDILNLKSIFSEMESFFHGKSSGIDPLNAYLQYPLHMKGRTDITLVGIPRHKFEEDGAIFLIDTGSAGKTDTGVTRFLNLCENSDYINHMQQEYLPLINSAISTLIGGRHQEFFRATAALSAFQLNHFHEMIPEAFIPAWKQGLETGDYHLKLCGSGGGGFILGFTQSLTQTRLALKDYYTQLVPVYRHTEHSNG
ncbi:MAG: mevalonate kinase [Bacteroidetes bacterium HGW-Bacteroidetes-22]|nr:MAG: mevalonate kinase [Bacteroidetes bacterium HGW-Bacteroidetes-22]